MYSLNVPIDPAVGRLADRLASSLPRAQERARGDRTLVAKRLGAGDHTAYARIEARVRDILRGTDPFQVRITGIEQFETAATGPSPVVYLAVESPPLCRLHERLCRAFDPVDGIEADDYVPHVTIARGGDPTAATELTERAIDPIEWTAEDLGFFDAERGQSASRVALPA